LPNPKTCEPRDVEDALAYAQRQSQLWDGPIYVEPIDGSDDALESARESWAVALGKWLKGTTLFRRLLMIFRQAEHDREDPLSWTDLVGRLASADLALKAITDDENRQRVIVSFFALVAYAQESRSGRAFPLAPTQVQLWIRELRRLNGWSTLSRPLPGWMNLRLERRVYPSFTAVSAGSRAGSPGTTPARTRSSVPAVWMACRS
jgi:DEAD/DEAH box helicase domain-containing protein